MAVKKRIKQKEHENLSDANVQKVADLLTGEKPITKKDACSILGLYLSSPVTFLGTPSFSTTAPTKVEDRYTLLDISLTLAPSR